jgi:DNA polymerase III sliding clamp (beta) subunit (PCNA family)
MKLPHTLLRRLTAILACLNRKPSLSILGHLYFTPVGPNILITASDLDLHLHWPLPTVTFGSLDQPASCPLDWFLKLAKAVRKDGHLELRLTEDGRTLCAYPSTGPSARSPERSLPIADMPLFSTAGFTRGGWLSHETLQHLTAAKDFISTDETRYVLQGSFISATGHCVATDGRRLCHRATAGTRLPDDIIVPAKWFPALLELSDGLLSENGSGRFWKGEVGGTRLPIWLNGGHNPETDVTHATDWMLVQSGDCLLNCHLIDGNFPNWRQVIPSSFNAMADLNADFLDTLRTTLARSPKRKETRVTFHLDPDSHLRADIYTSSGQTRTDLVDAHFLAGKHVIDLRQQHFSIAFDANLLLSALTTTGPRLRFTDDISPILIGDPVQGEAVLMPMRNATPATVKA